MQELFVIANFIDLDSKNFSTVMFYIVFFLSSPAIWTNKDNLPLCSPRGDSKVRCWEENPGVLFYRPRSAAFRGKAFLYKNKCLSSMNSNLCFIMHLAGSVWQAHLSHLPLYGNLTMPNPVAWLHQHKAVYWFQLALTIVMTGDYAPSRDIRLPIVVWSLKMSLGAGCGSSRTGWCCAVLKEISICILDDERWHSPAIWVWGSY